MAESDRRETLEIVRRCFAAWDRGDLEGVLAQYADDVVVDASRIAEGVVSVDDGAVREVIFYPDEAEGRRELG